MTTLKPSSRDAQCEGCGGVFPCMEPLKNLCGKCQLFEKYKDDNEKRQEIQGWPRCTMCGTTFRYMPIVASGNQVCESPMCLEMAAEQQIPALQSLTLVSRNQGVFSSSQAANMVPNTTALSEAQAMRLHQVRNRFKQSPVSHTATSGTHLTTVSLKQHEQPKTAPNSRLICFNFHRSDKPKSLDHRLGSSSFPIPLTTYIIDIQSRMLEVLNTQWTKDHSLPLILNEMSLHLSPNHVLEDGMTTKTLEAFIDHYLTPGMPSISTNPNPGQWKHILKSQKSPPVFFEGFINVELFEKRRQFERATNDENDSEFPAIGGCRCRRSDSITTTVTSRISKQPRMASGSLGHGPVGQSVIHSTFRLPSQRPAIQEIQKVSRVDFHKIICRVNDSDGTITFSELPEKVTGVLQDAPFAKGSMKVAYEVVLSDNMHSGLYVAKRFFRLSEKATSSVLGGPGGIDISEHNDQIQAECQQLYQGKWFLSAFYSHCSSNGVLVDDRIQFADAFLLREDSLQSPSPASGVATYTGELDGVMWLVERCRPSSTIRWSGTLSHFSSGSDLRSMTIYSFTHFVYGHSNKCLIFADLQGTPTHINGRDGLVLFDPMTHTLDCNSGIGDFGIDGINAFIRDHQCSEMCKCLGLNALVPLVPVEPLDVPDCRPTSKDSGKDVGRSVGEENNGRNGDSDDNGTTANDKSGTNTTDS